VITIHQRHRQTDGQTDRRTDGRTSSDPMTATLLKHVAVKTCRPNAGIGYYAAIRLHNPDDDL